MESRFVWGRGGEMGSSVLKMEVTSLLSLLFVNTYCTILIVLHKSGRM
jgi:hypothetical protein